MIAITKTQFGLQPANRATAMFVSNLGDGETFYADVRTEEAARSASQFNLFWMWVGEIAKHYGNRKYEQYESLKQPFIFPIVMRKHKDTADAFLKVKEILGPEEEAKMIKSLISIRQVSDMKDFAELLTDIEQHHRMEGIDLTRPDDLYFEAMARAA